MCQRGSVSRLNHAGSHSQNTIDPQYPGHYRLSFHDQAGPVSHLVYSTAEQALKEAISLGYREHTPGQLDRLSEDPHWQFGLARVSETYSALRR